MDVALFPDKLDKGLSALLQMDFVSCSKLIYSVKALVLTLRWLPIWLDFFEGPFESGQFLPALTLIPVSKTSFTVMPVSLLKKEVCGLVMYSFCDLPKIAALLYK